MGLSRRGAPERVDILRVGVLDVDRGLSSFGLLETDHGGSRWANRGAGQHGVRYEKVALLILPVRARDESCRTGPQFASAFPVGTPRLSKVMAEVDVQER